MGVREATCEHCMMVLYRGGDDSVCDDCALNPMKKDGSREKAIADTFKREGSFTLDELIARRRVMNEPR